MRWLVVMFLALAAGGCASALDSAAPDARELQLAAAGTSLADVLSAPHARLEDDRVITWDGAALPMRRWLPEGRPAAVVLALHGFNDYSNAFAAPGAELAARGIATYAYDQRGFGRAPGRGRWAGAGRLAEDAATVAALLRERYPAVPLYLMGESMGGAVAVIAATGRADAPRVEVDGVILAAPAVWGRQTMNVFERIGLWLVALAPGMELSQSVLPVTIHPSDNLPMLRALGADPLVIKKTRADALNGLIDLMGEALAAGRHFDSPALILYGDRDEIVPREPVARFVDSLPGAARGRQCVALYPQGYHLLLRDIQAPVVVADIAAWIRNRAAPLPSGADHDSRSQLTGQPPT